MKIRKALITIWLVILFGAIGYLFWQNEYVYSLPTPVPHNYKTVNRGDKITVPEMDALKENKPLFLHFFNPNCPCSRFNMAHFKSLVKKYSNDATFAIVVMSNQSFNSREIQDKFDLRIPVFFDSSIAASCGVYSTPQAVIIDKNDRLFYRGNYNKARYCTDGRSNYAEQALDSLLHHHNMVFNQYALKAYGCSLPNCTKK
jgi:hypothetical protein